MDTSWTVIAVTKWSKIVALVWTQSLNSEEEEEGEEGEGEGGGGGRKDEEEKEDEEEEEKEEEEELHLATSNNSEALLLAQYTERKTLWTVHKWHK